jgi:hypothetical protein
VDPSAHLNLSLSAYEYVQNNTLNRHDPDGRINKSAAFWAITKGILAGAGFAGGWAMELKGITILAGSGGTELVP